MKKSIIMIALIISLTFFGCGRNTPAPFVVYTGTDGLIIKFPDSAVPKKMFEGQELALVLSISNKGAFDLIGSNYGVASLDYDPLYFNEAILPTNKIFLHGRSSDYPNGENTVQQISALKVKNIPGTIEIPKTTLRASVCYPYQTILSKEVCIDQNYLGAESKQVCTNPGTYSFSSQGAPVAITKIEADMLPLGSGSVQPSFRITFRNVGGGLVIAQIPYKSVEENCLPTTDSTTVNNFNIIKVSAWLGSEDNVLACQPEEARLWNDEVEVTCTYPPGQQQTFTPSGEAVSNSNYMSLLTVKANYMYRNTISKEITLTRTG